MKVSEMMKRMVFSENVTVRGVELNQQGAVLKETVLDHRSIPAWMYLADLCMAEVSGVSVTVYYRMR